MMYWGLILDTGGTDAQVDGHLTEKLRVRLDIYEISQNHQSSLWFRLRWVVHLGASKLIFIYSSLVGRPM
jgi:hypothetical protein